MAARSTYFSAMLEGKMKESRQKEISIPSLDQSIASAILDFLYCEVVNVNPDNAVELLESSNLFR